MNVLCCVVKEVGVVGLVLQYAYLSLAGCMNLGTIEIIGCIDSLCGVNEDCGDRGYTATIGSSGHF